MRFDLDQLRAKNSHVELFHIEDKEFSPYGKVIKGYDFTEIESYMEDTVIPVEGNVYVASESAMEAFPVSEEIRRNFYGEMQIQIGYCNGRNSHLNGLEYHKGSEINFAVTDFVLLLGKVQEIAGNRYAAQGVQGFFVPKGTAIELYQTTLHFAPCKVEDEGFKCVVVLPKGTNTPLSGPVSKRLEEDDLLFMKNKWLLAHPDRKVLIDRGAYPGIEGDNIEVRY